MYSRPQSKIMSDQQNVTQQLKPLKIQVHRLPPMANQSVTVAPPQQLQPNVRKVPRRCISGHPSTIQQAQAVLHTFKVCQHVLKKLWCKMYLKCCVRNCRQAFRTFHSVKDLNVHHQIFHSETLFRCSVCPKYLQTPSAARFHKYKHQPPNYTCATCNKQLTYQSKLLQHWHVHIRQKMFKCFHRGCNWLYKHPQDLNRHAASNLGKKFSCVTYDYSSDQKRLLKCHLVVHQNEPKYKYHWCRAGFKHNNQIYRHHQKCT